MNDVNKCRFRIVLEGQETECVIRHPVAGEGTEQGEHEKHVYYAPKTGKKYEVELYDLETQ